MEFLMQPIGRSGSCGSGVGDFEVAHLVEREVAQHRKVDSAIVARHKSSWGRRRRRQKIELAADIRAVNEEDEPPSPGVEQEAEDWCCCTEQVTLPKSYKYVREGSQVFHKEPS